MSIWYSSKGVVCPHCGRIMKLEIDLHKKHCSVDYVDEQCDMCGKDFKVRAKVTINLVWSSWKEEDHPKRINVGATHNTRDYYGPGDRYD